MARGERTEVSACVGGGASERLRSCGSAAPTRLWLCGTDAYDFEEDGGEESWHWFCQLLAASPPVHFPRATS